MDKPRAFSSVFGWVLMDKTSTSPNTSAITMCATTNSINRTLQRFMEIENVPTVEKANSEDIECEKIYRSTTTCQPDGRYIVHLSFTSNLPVLGKSKDLALHRLY